MCIGDALTAVFSHLRVHNVMFKAPKPLKDLNVGPSNALLRAPLKPKVTTNEDKEHIDINEGLCMCIGDA